MSEDVIFAVCRRVLLAILSAADFVRQRYGKYFYGKKASAFAAFSDSIDIIISFILLLETLRNKGRGILDKMKRTGG